MPPLADPTAPAVSDAPLGRQLLAWADALAVHSDPGFAERGELAVTYLRAAHRAVSAQLQRWMRDDAGFDQVHEDALGNVIALYEGTDPASPRLLVGSHFDTVRNAGRYDGRLGIFAPMLAVRELARAGRRLPFGLELVSIAEEEGQHFQAGGLLGASALIGAFDPAWLDVTDDDGVTLAEALHGAGLDPAGIPATARDPARYRGWLELHIEQGPVLATRGVPLGVVTAINGAVRWAATVQGEPCHAGTTPMDARRDAAAAAAEMVLAVEAAAQASPGIVATVGMLEVPGGSINVVPGRCRFSIDMRAPSDAQRDEALASLRTTLRSIAARRGVVLDLQETMRVAAAPCDARLRQRCADAVATLGLPMLELPSGAGHDAMVLGRVMPQAMLFVRGGHRGISHSPRETVDAADAELAVRALLAWLEAEAREAGTA